MGILYILYVIGMEHLFLFTDFGYIVIFKVANCTFRHFGIFFFMNMCFVNDLSYWEFEY